MPLDAQRIHDAVALHQSGRLREAELAYRQMLAEDPNHPDLWHLLGVVAYQAGRAAMAVDYIGRAIGLFDRVAAYFCNLGEAYRVLHDLPKAERAFRHALELDPGAVDAHGNFALLLQTAGRFDEACFHADRAVELRPEHAESHNNRGLILQQLGRFAAAREAFVRAVKLKPTFSAPRQNLEQLANTLHQQGNPADALATFAAIVELQPNSAPAWSNYSVGLFGAGHDTEALEACRRALQIDPRCVDAWNNLGMFQILQGKLTEAEASLQQALNIRTDAVDALLNLASIYVRTSRDAEAEQLLQRVLNVAPEHESALRTLAEVWHRLGRTTEAAAIRKRMRLAKDQQWQERLDRGVDLLHRGRSDEASQTFEQALQLNPQHAVCHSNYLFSLLYLNESTPQRLLDAHREFDRRQIQPLRNSWRASPRPSDSERPLRLGFVSADLRHHPIGFLLQRLLDTLERTQFTTIVYSNRASQCETQQRLRSSAALWRDVEPLSDDQLADQIRADQIDLLFDLSGHTAGNRLLAFARRPAPIQISWLAYPSTTGVSAIDYLLTDERLTPLGAERWYSEKIVRLPEAWAVFSPPEQLPPLGPLPAVTPRSITFGSFNNPAKLNRRVVRLWCNVLEQLPLARLVLKFRGLDNPEEQDRIASWFAEGGVSRQRIEFIGNSPIDEMLAEYQRIDISLDTFPYTGGMTTIFALLMGVPVVTLPGETMSSRMTLSILSAIGMHELIAADAEDFVVRVLALVHDLPRLAELRRTLRARMLASAYCDGRKFTDQFASTLRQIWRAECDRV